MTTVARRLGLGLALVLVLGAPAAAEGQDPAWLLGRWVQVRDPDGSPKDAIVFAADGEATAIGADGRRFGGRYAVTGQQVEVYYKVGDLSVILHLTYGSDRERLFARSAVTGRTAVYEKRP